MIPSFTFDIAGFLFTQGDKTHGARVECYMNVAKMNQNARACELINGVYAGKCYVGMVKEGVGIESLKQKYLQICKAVPESYRRDLCYLEAVRSLDNIEASITYWGMRDTSLCNNIENTEYHRICMSIF